MYTGNWFKDNYPDLVVDAYNEGNVLVIDIPHGRIKIMPEHRKPRRNKKNLHS
mgnify:CR=1 FL=1